MPAIMMLPTATTVAGEEPENGGEQRTREQRSHRQPAAKVADKRVRERDHALRHAAGRHERARAG